MASITLEIIIEGLENSDLKNYESTFDAWLNRMLKSHDAPKGDLDNTTETAREEDDEDEEE